MDSRKSKPHAIVKAEYKENDNSTYFEFDGSRHDVIALSLSIVKALYDEYDFDIDDFCILARKICNETHPTKIDLNSQDK